MQTLDKTKIFYNEIYLLNNVHIKKDTGTLINLLPDYFFEIPAASSGKYHPAFSQGNGGLLRHTKTAFRIAFELLSNPLMDEEFTRDEKDIMLLGIIVHDGLKSGKVKEEYTRFDHSLLMVEFLKEHQKDLAMTPEQFELLCTVVASHMGPWNKNNYSNIILPLPKTKYEKFVHYCDYLSSKKFLDIKFDENNNIIER